MIGRTVSKYRVSSKLGEGGMGVVWKAQDLVLGRTVALKFLPVTEREDENVRDRFRREATAASSLDHPNICTIFEIGESDEGQLFIAMPCYDGDTVKQKIVRGPLALDEAVDIAAQTATGLAKAHALGIVHRDIKPSNLILTQDGIVKILDFGLASLPHAEELTHPGKVVGTLSYISPERLQGHDGDHRADIWSLGVVLYEMIAGRRPFVAAGLQDLMINLMQQDPPPLPQVREDVSDRLQGIVAKALAKSRKSRYQEMGDFIRDLAPIYDEGRAARLSWSRRGSARVGDQSQSNAIAVLPFENVSGDAGDEYFSDGLTEELITTLSRLEKLRVVSRTSAFEFKGKAQNVRRIGEVLRVGAVLEGQVRRSGNRVRVTVHLTEARSGFTLWSETFDRVLEDAFEIQDDIAGSLARRLALDLQPGDVIRRRHTPGAHAYQLYLRGRFHWNKLNQEGLEKSLRFFEEAISEDPKYALAHVGVADFYSILGFWAILPPNEAWPQARKAAERALEIDPDLAEAHLALGLAELFYDWRTVKAEACFQRALRLNPGLANGHFYMSTSFAQTGHLHDAQEQIEQASLLDPLSLLIAAMVGWVHYYARDPQSAIAECRTILAYEPNFFEARAVLGLSHIDVGDHGKGLEELEKASQSSERNSLVLGMLGAAYGSVGHEEKALEILVELDELAKLRYVAPIAFAILHSGRGDTERAFEWLDRAIEARDGYLRYIKVLPIYDPLRSDARFAGLLREVGLSDASTTDPTLPIRPESARLDA